MASKEVLNKNEKMRKILKKKISKKVKFFILFKRRYYSKFWAERS